MATKTKRLDQQILDTLTKLGGQQAHEDTVVHEGTRLVLPANMTVPEAIRFLNRWHEQQEESTRFSKQYNYRPWDVAAALHRAVIRLTGTSGINLGVPGFFGNTPPELRSIKVGVGEEIQVPAGWVEVPMIGGQLLVHSAMNPELGPLGIILVEAPRKYRSAVDGLFKVVEDELRTGSIYRGKAFDGQVEPDFLDLRGVDPDKVVYSDEVIDQLDANIWSALKYTDEMRRNDVPLKRAVLLEGPYGTGKTLAAFLTAQQAVDNKWTFIYARPGRDDLHDVMATARLYQPSVVFFEDVDTISSEFEGEDAMTGLLDLFDGINAKGTEILVVLTTNHKEKIRKGMVRPGRLDGMIHIGGLDRNGIQRLVEVTVPANLRSDLDYDLIAESFGVGTDDPFLPSFAKEAIDRTLRYAISRSGGKPGKLTTEDFVKSAEGLRPQLDLMNGAHENAVRDTVGEALIKVTREGLDGTRIKYDEDPAPIAELVSNGNHH